MKREPRGCLPVVGTVVAVVVVTFGGYVVAGATRQPPVAVELYERPGRLVVVPPVGWVLAGRDLDEDFRGVSLTNGSANLEVLAAPGLELYLESLDEALDQFQAAEPEDGRRRYSGYDDGSSFEGELFERPGIVFDAWASEGELAAALDEVHAMQDGAVQR